MVFVQKSEYFSFNLMLSHFFFSSFNRFQMNVISLCTWQKFKSNLQASKKKFLFHYVQSTDLPSLTTNLANSKRKFTHILKNRSGNSYILKYFIEKKKSSSSKDKKKKLYAFAYITIEHLSHVLYTSNWINCKQKFIRGSSCIIVFTLRAVQQYFHVYVFSFVVLKRNKKRKKIVVIWLFS